MALINCLHAKHVGLLQPRESETFCYPKTLLPSMDTALWYQRTVAVFSIAIFLLIIVVVFMVVNFLRSGNISNQYKIVKTADDS